MLTEICSRKTNKHTTATEHLFDFETDTETVATPTAAAALAMLTAVDGRSAAAREAAAWRLLFCFRRGAQLKQSSSSAVQQILRAHAPALLRGVATFRPAAAADAAPTIRGRIAVPEEAQLYFREAVVLPMRFPQLFSGARMPHRALMVFGPNGCGLRSLVDAAAAESKASVVTLDFEALLLCNRHFGGTRERMLELAYAAAKERAPCVLVMCGLETFHRTRRPGHSEDEEDMRRCMTELLVQMQEFYRRAPGSEALSIVVGIVRKPWLLDVAIRRRFERRVFIGLPEPAERRAVLEQHLHGMAVGQELVAASNGLTLAEIVAVCRSSSVGEEQQQLMARLAMAPRSVSQEEIAMHVGWKREYA